MKKLTAIPGILLMGLLALSMPVFAGKPAPSQDFFLTNKSMHNPAIMKQNLLELKKAEKAKLNSISIFDYYLQGIQNNTEKYLYLGTDGLSTKELEQLFSALENNTSVEMLFIWDQESLFNSGAEQSSEEMIQLLTTSLKKNKTIERFFLVGNYEDEKSYTISPVMFEKITMALQESNVNDFGFWQWNFTQEVGKNITDLINTGNLSKLSLGLKTEQDSCDRKCIDAAVTIAQAIGKSQISSLYLGVEGMENNVEVSHAISEAAISDTSLKSFSLSGLIIDAPAAKNFAKAFSKNKSLTEIGFFGNKMDDAIFSPILSSLQNYSALEIFYFWEQKTTSVDTVNGLVNLYINNPLDTFGIYDAGKFGVDAIQALTEKLKNDNTLLRLSLSTAGVDDAGMRLLTEALTQNTALEFLDIADGEYSTEALRALLSVLETNHSLLLIWFDNPLDLTQEDLDLYESRIYRNRIESLEN